MIITVAGNGAAGSSGNGGPPTAAELNDPTCAVPTAPGDLMIVDSGNSVVRFVSAGSGGEGEAVSVAPAQLSITAVSQTMIVGSPVPQLTATYAGFVNGDTPARLVTAPSLSTSASSSSSIGSYPIVASGASSPNYHITFVDGTLSVIPVPPMAVVRSISIKKIKLGKHKTTQVIVLTFNEALDHADAAANQLI